MNWKIYWIFNFGVMLCGSTAFANNDEAINDLVTKITNQEKRCLNLTIDKFELTEERRDSGDKPWNKTSTHITGKAYYNGLRASKGRIDFSELTFPNEQGSKAGTFVLSVGFDGTIGRCVWHSSGQLPKLIDVRQGAVQNKVPDRLFTDISDLATGVMFYIGLQKPLLSSEIHEWQKAGAKIDLIDEVHEDKPLRHLKLENKDHGLVEYWFDPARQYAIVRKRVSIMSKGLTNVLLEDIVTELALASDKLWYPTRASRFRQSSDGTEVRHTYKAGNVRANDPTFKDEIFAVPIPAGYLVDDEINNRHYRSTGELSELKTSLDKFTNTADKVLKEGETPRVIAQKAPVEPPVERSAEKPIAVEDSGRIYPFVVLEHV